MGSAENQEGRNLVFPVTDEIGLGHRPRRRNGDLIGKFRIPRRQALLRKAELTLRLPVRETLTVIF